jgi:integrase
LNRALKEGHSGDPQAWQLDPLMDDIDEGSNAAVFLSPGQRKSLIDAASPSASAFMRGLEFTGARPGELAASAVADFDEKRACLMLSHRKGRPAKLRTRAVVLSPEGVAFFRAQARRKLPTARLFLNPNHRPWERKEWAAEIRLAAATVNLKARGKKRIPPGASAYAFRHSRISELLQVHQIDPLTVALQVGTSMSMLEKYYYKFIPAALREKLAAVDGA